MLIRVQLFETPWTVAHQSSLSFTISWSLLKLMSTESEMPSNHLILCHPFLLMSSIFPSIRDLSKESALCIRWPKYWNFNISHSNEVGWFPLILVGLISLLFKDSQESSPAAPFESISSLVLSLLYGLTLTSVHDFWKNYSFDYTDLCWQSNVSAF